ncbi:MAG: aldehyde dehydrogenase family protein, partial [Amphiplicatus sp.]
MAEGLFINGSWREGTGAAFQSFDPSTGAPVCEAQAATRADGAAAVSAARAAFPAWSRTPA